MDPITYVKQGDEQVDQFFVEKGSVNCIPSRNEENYLTFTKNIHVDTVVKSEKQFNIYSRLKFLDTMNFMKSSLAKLVKNLERSQFKHTSQYFDALDLMLQKGIYPYEYMTDISKFKETELPPREAFASWLGAAQLWATVNFDRRKSRRRTTNTRRQFLKPWVAKT